MKEHRITTIWDEQVKAERLAAWFSSRGYLAAPCDGMVIVDGTWFDVETPETCESCGSELSDFSRDAWMPGDTALCEKCDKHAKTVEWIESTVKNVEAMAEKHGWGLEDRSGGFNTRSVYLTFGRDGFDDDGDDACQTAKVRVSDHGDMYCRDDLSISMNPTPEDHTLGQVEAMFSSGFVAD